MAPITETAIVPSKRVYPHVPQVTDWAAQQTIRLLWDRIFDLTEQITAARATIATLVAGQNTTQATLTTVQQQADQALAVSQLAKAAVTAAGEEDGADSPPGGGDGGGGQEGCAAAGATGHDTGGLLSAVRAGQIVCGTAHEFPALLNATATIEQRDDNAEELIRRMIWHLRNAGFDAGRQQNPSGAVSKDKLCVVVDGVTRAYDVFVGKNNPAAAMSTAMSELSFVQLIDDAGIPDS